MRFTINKINNGPFTMYQVVDNDCNPPMVIITTSNWDEADEMRELQEFTNQEG